MTPAELFAALLDLARDVGLEVRRVPAEEAGSSGVCRVRDRFWVMLSSGDPLDVRNAVLAGALCDHAAAECEARFLPPAVRRALEEAEGAESVRRP